MSWRMSINYLTSKPTILPSMLINMLTSRSFKRSPQNPRKCYLRSHLYRRDPLVHQKILTIVSPKPSLKLHQRSQFSGHPQKWSIILHQNSWSEDTTNTLTSYLTQITQRFTNMTASSPIKRFPQSSYQNPRLNSATTTTMVHTSQKQFKILHESSRSKEVINNFNSNPTMTP
jgi:hypothetical protein